MKKMFCIVTLALAANISAAHAGTQACIFGEDIHEIEKMGQFTISELGEKRVKDRQDPDNTERTHITVKETLLKHKISGKEYVMKTTFNDEDDGGNTRGWIEGRSSRAITAFIGDSSIEDCKIKAGSFMALLPDDIANRFGPFSNLMKSDNVSYGRMAQARADVIVLESVRSGSESLESAIKAFEDRLAKDESETNALDLIDVKVKTLNPEQMKTFAKDNVEKLLKNKTPRACVRITGESLKDVKAETCKPGLDKVLRLMVRNMKSVVVVERKLTSSKWGNSESALIVYAPSALHRAKGMVVRYELNTTASQK